jgi:hypothetical protein
MIFQEKMFTKEECEAIIYLSKDIEKQDSNLYFKNENDIKYNVWNIQRTSKTQWIFDRLFNYFTNTTGIKIEKQLDIVHLHNYKQGNKFTKHNDNLYPTQIHNIGVCLNDDYVGGEFILYEPYEILPKKQGEMYTFESLRLHEVKKIINGKRYSLIIHVKNSEIKKALL